jgi:hypothetical protein
MRMALHEQDVSELNGIRTNRLKHRRMKDRKVNPDVMDP